MEITAVVHLYNYYLGIWNFEQNPPETTYRLLGFCTAKIYDLEHVQWIIKMRLIKCMHIDYNWNMGCDRCNLSEGMGYFLNNFIWSLRLSYKKVITTNFVKPKLTFNTVETTLQ